VYYLPKTAPKIATTTTIAKITPIIGRMNGMTVNKRKPTTATAAYSNNACIIAYNPYAKKLKIAKFAFLPLLPSLVVNGRLS
jgi:hypothetical protein